MSKEYNDVLVTYTDGATEDSIHLPAENEGDWDIVWRLELRKKHSREYVDKCQVVAVRFPDGQLVEAEEAYEEDEGYGNDDADSRFWNQRDIFDR